MSKARAFINATRVSTGVVWHPVQYPFANHTYFLQVYPQKRVFDTSEDWKQVWIQKHPNVRFIEYNNEPDASLYPGRFTTTKKTCRCEYYEELE